jgi:uncharacterized RDD family membrane protein YckC
MTDLSQDYLNDIEKTTVKYSTFWQRFFAILIDCIVLTPFAIIDTFNKTTWKSYPVFFAAFLIMLAYKPFFEIRYGATLGKMAIKLTVVNTAYQKADIRNVMLRNVFDIFDRLLLSIIALITFSSPGVEDTAILKDYADISNMGTISHCVTAVTSILAIVDSIFLLTDSRKRALHDRIGQTYVIQK